MGQCTIKILVSSALLTSEQRTSISTLRPTEFELVTDPDLADAAIVDSCCLSKVTDADFGLIVLGDPDETHNVEADIIATIDWPSEIPALHHKVALAARWLEREHQIRELSALIAREQTPVRLRACA